MSDRRVASISESRCGLFLAGLLFVSMAQSAQEPSSGFTPIAPAAAIHTALQGQWGVVREWLKGKDYASAGEAVRGLSTLVHLYGYQAVDPAWQKRTAKLQAACTRLAEAVQRKAATDATQALEECGRLLEDMAKNPPMGPKVVAPDYKPVGSIKTWMLLLDGAYVDAKSAKTPQQLEQLTQAIAEQAHATAYLRTDARWRELSRDVRDTALQVAQIARKGELDAARQALKQVYQRCETCHNRYQK